MGVTIDDNGVVILTFSGVQTKHFESAQADYATVPAGLTSRVCGCRGASKGYVNNQTASKPNPPDGVPFEWWVCYDCMKPASLNALNARLIRECENCEQPYFVKTWPDKMNLCEGCDN